MKRYVKKGCFLLMLVGLLAVMCGCGSKKINLNDYLTYEVTGADGYGKVQYKFDEGTFEDDLIAVSGMSGGWHDLDVLYDVEKKVESGAWDKKDGLRNGDVITYTWNVNPKMLKERYDVVFTYKTIKVKVDGLQKAEAFDPFDQISIKVSGNSPSAKLEIEEIGEHTDGFSFEADKTSELKNGDEVTITFYYHSYADDLAIEDCANKLGKVPSRTQMTYTVEGLDSYVETLSQIPQETVDAMVEEAETDIRAGIARDWENPDTLQNLEYIGCYVMSAKDLSSSYWDDFVYNKVYIVHKITVKNEGATGSFDYFYFTRFTNALAKTDGTVDVNLNDTVTPDGGTNFIGLYGAAFQASGLVYVGYATYDDLYNDIVTAQSDSFTIDDNVKEPENAVYYEDVERVEEE